MFRAIDKENTMSNNSVLRSLEKLIQYIPTDWVNLTTHRLDIYHEELAKKEFLQKLAEIIQSENFDEKDLSNLPTAYDYIRLGHPLSCVLEWALAEKASMSADSVITFSSNTMPLMAVLRSNTFKNKTTQIVVVGDLPSNFDARLARDVYGYLFDIHKVNDLDEIPSFDDPTLLYTTQPTVSEVKLSKNTDYTLVAIPSLGSVLYLHDENVSQTISEVQHVRRRESIAMTPSNCMTALKSMVGQSADLPGFSDSSLEAVEAEINDITATNQRPLVASSGLSMQYALMMGLMENALNQHPGKEIKIIVPPNCYGGTNDQARRVAEGLKNASVVDLPVDGDNDMVQSIDQVLEAVAQQDAIPYIIAEIPTNPRVEVPNLQKLREALIKPRQTPSGKLAIAPVFIIDQTFCPNVQFLKPQGIFAGIKTLSYVSGSKFPSGGKCTAGYCVANEEAKDLMTKIESHLALCDNAATPLQIEILAKQMPSMLSRINDAYKNTREFVSFIHHELSEAKINFVSEELAAEGFTPSVFSLDLPSKGETPEARELHKRALNLQLINLMITKIPDQSKYCVSYGQLKGCYWTIPATSTQGTTKQGDKDYIARVSVSPDLDLEKHKEVFREFVGLLRD